MELGIYGKCSDVRSLRCQTANTTWAGSTQGLKYDFCWI